MNSRVKITKTALVALTISVISTTYANAVTYQSKRLWGNDRYVTSAAISKAGWTSTSDYAVIVNGENFPDALSAVTLAKKFNAPILLTESNTLDTNTNNELKRLNVKNVLIVGGNGAVNSLVEKSIQDMGISTTRYQGQDRDTTSIEVAKTIGTANGIIVTTDNDFTDALSAAPIAAKLQMPMILVPKDKMPDSVKSFISSNNIPKTYILGGTDIISDTVASQFPNTERIEGNDKYERNINIIKAFSSEVDFSNICFAYSERFPDALSGAAFAAMKGNPIILVGENISGTTESFVKSELKPDSNITVFGGVAGVTDDEISLLTGADNNSDLATLESNANDYFINSDFDKLIDTTTKIIALDPSNLKAYDYRAYAYSETYQFQNGIEDCTKVISMDPNDILAYSTRGILYDSVSQFDKAKDDYNKAITLSGDSMEFYWARGNAYASLGKYNEAIADLNKAITLNPKFAMAYNDLGVVTSFNGDRTGAFALYNKALQINPNLPDANNAIGNYYRDIKKDYDTAITYYNKDIELNKSDSVAYYCRGTAYYYAKQYDKAIADLEKSIEINPNYARSHNMLGNVYYGVLENGKAKDEYDKAISLNPNDAAYYKNRGDCYFNYQDTADYIKAIADYNKAIELDPNHIGTYESRGFAYSNNDQYDKAITDFTKVLQNDPNNETMYEARGWAYYNLKEYSQAIDDYSKAIQMNPNSYNAYINRAQCYTALNQLDKAKSDEAKADEIKKNNAN